MTFRYPIFLAAFFCAFMPASFAVVPQQKFVERSKQLGVRHTSLAGFDAIGGVSDWTQTGVAIGDIDGDGDPDVVLCGGIHKNTVLRNDRPIYTDITERSGIDLSEFDRAVAMGDYDNDGDLDLYFGALSTNLLPVHGNNRLYQNDGSGKFSDVTDLAGVPGAGHTLFVQWFDLDRDGLLDLLVSEFQVSPNECYRNNGDGTFTERGALLGLDWGGSSHATAVLDTDGDGGLDVFVANDWLVTWIVGLPSNQGDSQLAGPAGSSATPFQDVSSSSGLDLNRAIMGLAFGDLDYDGDFDLYKTDVGGNYYFENLGWPSSGQAWEERQHQYNIVSGYSPDPATPGSDSLNSSWGAVFFNADADLMQDLLVVNGHVAGIVPGSSHLGRDEPNDLYWGVAPSAPLLKDDGSAGLADPIDDRGLAIGDMDLDGDLDIFVTPTAGYARFYENQIDRQGQGWLQVVAESHTSAPGGIGAIAKWTDSAGLIHQRAIGSDGPTASQHEPLAHFGMGLEPFADVLVTFPSGIEIGPLHALPNTRVVAVEPKMFGLSSRVLPIASLAPPGMDRLTVDVFAYSQDGSELGPTDTVVVDVPGLVPLGPLTPVSGNHFRREFGLATSAGAFEVFATFAGWQPSVVPVVQFRGALDPFVTGLAAHPKAVRSLSSDTFCIVVSPKDANGLSLGPGQLISVLLPGVIQSGPVVDLGEGRYEVTFQSAANAGKYYPVVLVNGETIAPGPAIDIAGVVDPATSEVTVTVPMPFHSASPDEIRILVLPKDAQGVRLGPAAKVTMTFTEDNHGGLPFVPSSKYRRGSAASGIGSPSGTFPLPSRRPLAPQIARRVTQRNGVFPGGQADGEFHFILKKTSGMPTYMPTGSIVISVDGTTFPPIPYAF
jgi:hypothetical protein